MKGRKAAPVVPRRNKRRKKSKRGAMALVVSERLVWCNAIERYELFII